MQHEVDADFARYVAARQRQLVRAAFLVCGSARMAPEVVEGALATVASRWQRVRDYPDTVVRRHVYRDAMAAAKAVDRDSLTAGLSVEQSGGLGVEPAVGRDGDLLRALASLNPKQRALVVLRHFEERSEADTAEVLGESESAVTGQTRAALEQLGTEPGPGLGDALDRASQELPETDLADRAWALALRRRRTRRQRLVSLVSAAAVVAVVAVAAQAVQGRRHTPVPPGPTTTTTAPVNRLSDGTIYATMPLEGQEDRLPDYDAGLPSVIDPGARAVRLSTLDQPPTSVVAVYLRASGENYRAVLVPKDRPQVIVDGLDLLPTRDSGGNAGVPLGPKGISPDGRWVVFAQPDAVVRLDLKTGTVARVDVPGQDLTSVGWVDGRSVVAGSDRGAWTLDLSSSSPRPVATRLPTALNEMVSGPVTELHGDTVSAGQWAASGAFFDQVVTSPVIVRGNGPIYQGLLAVDTQARSGRVLLAPESPDGQTGRVLGCCSVLSWADASTVLFRSTGYDGSWILAWNVETGRVYDVTRLDEGRGVNYPQALALAVGSRG